MKTRVLFATVALAAVVSYAGNTWYACPTPVAGASSDPDYCKTPELAGTIKDAIGLAVTKGDVVILKDGDYAVTEENWAPEGSNLEIKKGITIQSESLDPDQCVIYGKGADGKCFNAFAANVAGVVIQGISFIDFSPSSGILFSGVSGALAQMKDCKVVQCCTGTAGRKVFGGNNGTWLARTWMLYRCAIVSNGVDQTANWGLGGCYNCLFLGNIGEWDGAMYNCSFIGNRTGKLNPDGSVIKSWNTCLLEGSGTAAQRKAVNCLFAGNKLASGSLYSWNSGQIQCSVPSEFSHCVYEGNLPPVLIEDESNLEYDEGLIRFVNEGEHPYQLKSNSMAVDVGTEYEGVKVEGGELSTDLLGNARVWGKTIDIGCYEYFEDISDPTEIKESWVEVIPVQIWHGPALYPKVVVRNGDGVELTEGQDFTVEYADNQKEGEATVTVVCKGTYHGTVATTFLIVRGKLLLWAKADAVGGEDCLTRATAGRLADAIEKTEDGDEVVLLDGEHFPEWTADGATLKAGVTVRSESGNRAACIVNGGGETGGRRCFTVGGPQVAVSNLTIRFFHCLDSHGGAICVPADMSVEKSVTIRGCDFIGNCCGRLGNAATDRGRGGAIYCGGGFSSVDVFDCLFSGNCARNYAGAVSAGGRGSLTDCSFIGNCVSNSGESASCRSYGGAVTVSDGFVATNCLFASNRAYRVSMESYYGATFGLSTYRCRYIDNAAANDCNQAYGGTHIESAFVNRMSGKGIVSEQYSVIGVDCQRADFIRCVFTNNVNSLLNTGTLTSCLIAENSGTFYFYGTVDFYNCTFANNAVVGGWNTRILGEKSAVVNCLMSGNSLSSGAMIPWSGGQPGSTTDVTKYAISNTVYQGAVHEQWDCNNNIQLESSPQKVSFRGKGDHPYALRRGSLGREYGLVFDWMTNGGAKAFDLEGKPRLTGDKPDLGGYEYLPSGNGLMILLR